MPVDHRGGRRRWLGHRAGQNARRQRRTGNALVSRRTIVFRIGRIRGKTAPISPALCLPAERLSALSRSTKPCRDKRFGHLRGAVARGARGFFQSRRQPCRDDDASFAAQKVSKKRASKRWAELLVDIFGAGRKQRHAFLSGPTFAIEVAQQITGGGHRCGLRRRSGAIDPADSQHAKFASLYFGRRHRRADRRGGEKHYRHRRRHQRWLGLGPKCSRGVDHPRSCRDDPIGGAHGRRSADSCRPAGLRRFDSHLRR